MHDDGTAFHDERPLFMDVAVQSFVMTCGGRYSGDSPYVYAAIDHLGWAKFDPAVWDENSPIVHHEGKIKDITNPGGHVTKILTPVENPGKRITYTRRIQVHELCTGLSSVPEPVLVVTAGKRPARAWKSVLNEGRVLDYVGDKISKLENKTWFHGENSDHYPLVYRGLTDSPANSALEARIVLDAGGYYAHGPVHQDAGEPFVFFTGEHIVTTGNSNQSKMSTGRYEIEASTSPGVGWGDGTYANGVADLTNLRDRSDRPGRKLWVIGSMLPPNEHVLVTSHNDQPVAQEDRLLYLDTAGELQETSASVTEPGSFGVSFDARAQWTVDNPSAPGGKDPWVFGTKNEPLRRGAELPFHESRGRTGERAHLASSPRLLRARARRGVGACG